MAENLDDGEFWLPPQFLADDDGDMEKITTLKSRNAAFWLDFEGDSSRGLFLHGFGSHGFSSDLSSPVESLVGSSETESDEEEQQHMAELTRKLAHSSIRDGLGSEKPKGPFFSGSPQSTLCAFGSGCGCMKGSSNGSPNSVCQIASPRATWDLLHAAAEEVERMRLSEEGYGGFNHHRGLLGPPRKPSPPLTTTLSVKNTNPDLGFYTRQSLSHQQLQIAQFQMLRHQQMVKQQQQQNNSAVWGGGQANKAAAPVVANCLYQSRQSNHHQMIQNNGVGRNSNRPLGLSPSSWPTLRQAKQQQNQQQQFGSGMRAVFLGNPTGKRESAGTGVFLPRCVDNPAESKRKPACSTVLVPARVAQALNLKMEDMMGGQPQYQPRFNGSLNMENDVAVHHRSRSNGSYPQQKRNLRPQPPVNHHEIRLPQDWTY